MGRPDTYIGGGVMKSSSREERFTAVYRSHCAQVERYVMRRVHADAVPDVVAEVFLTAWRRAEDIPHASALPWLYGVARRVLANDRRARQRRADLVDLLAGRPEQQAGCATDEVVTRMDLARAVRELSAGDQEVLRLVLWEELTLPEAAVALGCSTVAARVRMHRARRRLRRRLEAVDETAACPNNPVRAEVGHAQH